MQSFFGIHKRAIFAGVFFIVSLGLLAYTTSMLVVEKNAVHALIENSFAEDVRWKAARSIARQIKKSKDDRAFLQSLVIVDKDIAGMIADIEALGRSSGVSIRIKSIGVNQQNEGSSLLSLGIVTSGSRTNTLVFLSRFEDAPYAIRFGRVGMEMLDTGVWEGNIVCSIMNYNDQ
jgi:hypothetical protein